MKRINAAWIDETLETIAGSATNPAEQLKQYDLLLQKARNLKYKRGVAHIIKQMVTILMAQRRYGEVELLLKEGLQIVNALNERNDLYIYLRAAEAMIRAVHGAHHEAVEIIQELVNNYGATMKPETLIRCYLTAGNAYWFQGLLYNAMYTLQKVLSRRDELSGVENYNIVWMTYANILKDLKLHEKAKDEMAEILKHAKLSAREKIIMNLNLLNLYGGAFQDYEKSHAYRDECYRLLEQTPFPELKMGVDINWLTTLVSLGRYEEALPLLTDHDIMQPGKHAVRDSAEWCYIVSVCFLRTGQIEKAEPWLKRAEKLAIDTGLLRHKIFCYDNYFLYHSLKNNTEEARKYHYLYKDALDEENVMVHNLQARQLEALVELERKQHELEIEKLRRQQTEQEASHARQQNALMQANIEQRNKLIDEFQSAIKRLELSDVRRKEIFKGLHDKINTVKQGSNELATYDTKFNVRHQQQVHTLQLAYPTITPSEAKIAVMLASGLSNKEVAGITLTTPRNIETQRLTIRKKLKLSNGQDLLEKLHQILK